jgi:uncharacterized protein
MNGPDSRRLPLGERPRPLPGMALLVLLAFLFPSFSPAASAFAADPAIPALTGRVVDQAGILPVDRRLALESSLEAFERAKGSQVAVLTVATTAPWSIEQFSIKLAEAWKIGREGPDDGAILVVARDDRALRIEVGRGLEGALTDLVSKRIIEDIMVPHFRSGDMASGVEAGVDAMLKVIEGEELPAPEPRGSGGGGIGGSLENILGLVFIGSLFFGHMFRSVLGRFMGGGIGGSLAGLVVWFLAGSLFMGVLLGLVAFLVIAFGGLLGGFGGGRGGGFGGGGGFSGGGGSFGGGGASGRW